MEATNRIPAPTTQRRTRAVPQIKSTGDGVEQQRPVDTHLPPTPEKSVRLIEAGASKVSFDRPLHAAVAHFTLGISPAALSQAYIDWLQHILFSPDKQFALTLHKPIFSGHCG